MAEKSSWDQANILQKLCLVRRNRKKIESQIIKDYFYLPFFLLIILFQPIEMSGLLCLLLLLATEARLCSGREEGWNWGGGEQDPPAQEGVSKNFQIKFKLLILTMFPKNGTFCVPAAGQRSPGWTWFLSYATFIVAKFLAPEG
jgi:hypothetical protein